MPPQPGTSSSNAATVAQPARRQPAGSGGPRKRAANADDAAYHSTTASAKRAAADKGDGEHRAKRKRVDHIIDGVSGIPTSGSRRAGAGAGGRDGDIGVSASAGTRRLGGTAANMGLGASGSGERDDGRQSLVSPCSIFPTGQRCLCLFHTSSFLLLVFVASGSCIYTSL